MKLSSSLIKLCAASLLVGGAVSLDLVRSQPAYAGCGDSRAYGWSVDASTGRTIENFGVGKVVECGNMHGSFASFSHQDSRFGWSVCYQNCQDGWQPNTLYIEVNGTRDRGEVIELGPNSPDGSCVQPSGSQTRYCWGVM